MSLIFVVSWFLFCFFSVSGFAEQDCPSYFDEKSITCYATLVYKEHAGIPAKLLPSFYKKAQSCVPSRVCELLKSNPILNFNHKVIGCFDPHCCRGNKTCDSSDGRSLIASPFSIVSYLFRVIF